MTFAVEADSYDRHVGRYSGVLGRELVRVAGVRPPMRALDVGAGTGKLTAVLADVLDEENVAAVDPSDTFAEALRARFPRADVRQGVAEALPFGDSSFDAALAQLVVNFMRDPDQGVAEMIRVVRRGGVVAAAVWDYPGRMTLLTTFWDAVDALGGSAADERTAMRFDAEGELAELWRQAGLRGVEEGPIVVSASYESFEDLWEPFRAGVGPAGAYAASLAPAAQEELREEFHRRLGSPAGPFQLDARAWYAVGTT